MSQTPTFRTVMRGYEPGEVDARLRSLADELSAAQAVVVERDHARQQAAELAARVQSLESEQAGRPAPASAPTAASYESLGQRIAQMLGLADAEAKGLRDQAVADAEAHRQQVHTTAGSVQADADRYAQEQRSAADADATRIREDAKRAADEMLDDADRHATARREEAEAVYENQRARAAQAAADFETTLAHRRTKAEKEFMDRGTASEAELEAVQDRTELLRQEAERAHRDAMAQAARELDEAREKAAEIVSAAQARATRVRAESDREVAAASQRRDSINAQLTNVRQMLATLSGTGPAPANDPAPSPTPTPTPEPEPEPEPESGADADPDAADDVTQTTAETPDDAPAPDEVDLTEETNDEKSGDTTVQQPAR